MVLLQNEILVAIYCDSWGRTAPLSGARFPSPVVASYSDLVFAHFVAMGTAVIPSPATNCPCRARLARHRDLQIEGERHGRVLGTEDHAREGGAGWLCSARECRQCTPRPIVRNRQPKWSRDPDSDPRSLPRLDK